jgi:hypothetical protein
VAWPLGTSNVEGEDSPLCGIFRNNEKRFTIQSPNKIVITAGSKRDNHVEEIHYNNPGEGMIK